MHKDCDRSTPWSFSQCPTDSLLQQIQLLNTTAPTPPTRAVVPFPPFSPPCSARPLDFSHLITPKQQFIDEWIPILPVVILSTHACQDSASNRCVRMLTENVQDMDTQAGRRSQQAIAIYFWPFRLVRSEVSRKPFSRYWHSWLFLRSIT